MGCSFNLLYEYLGILSLSFLSIIGSLIIILAYLLKPGSRIYSFRLVFYTAISDLFRSITLSIPCNELNNKFVIGLIAYLLHSSTIISCIWTTAISNTLYQIVVNSNNNFEKNHRFWVAITILVLICNIFPMSLGYYASNNTLCTYPMSPIGNILRVLLLFLPMWIFIIILLVGYAQIYCKMKKVKIGETQKHALKKLFIFPFLTIIIYIPLSMVRVLQSFVEECEYSIYYVVSIFIFSLHGFCFSLGYLWSFRVKLQFITVRMSEHLTNNSINSIRSSSTNLLVEETDNE
jgi:hypothetical protein